MRPTVGVLALALALTGCAGGAYPGAVPSGAASPTPTVSIRGYLLKSVGQPATIRSEDGAPLAAFVVTGIEVDPECTGPEALPPEHGRFVRFDVEFESFADLPVEMIFAAGSWEAVDAHGDLFAGIVGTWPAHRCLPDGERFPDTVGPGAERVSGSIVFDVPTGSGALMHTLGSGGWEWRYPG